MSQSKIYVGNLSYRTSEEDLAEEFSKVGEIVELRLILDRETGRSKGFAFITFANEESAKDSLKLHDSNLDGRQIKVSFAREEQRTGGGGGGGAGYGNRRFGGNNSRRNGSGGGHRNSMNA